MSLPVFWRGHSVLKCAEKERQSLGFTVTICWTTGESFKIKLLLHHCVSILNFDLCLDLFLIFLTPTHVLIVILTMLLFPCIFSLISLLLMFLT